LIQLDDPQDHRSELTKAQAMHGAVTGRISRMECNEAGGGRPSLSKKRVPENGPIDQWNAS
jgi:hypothetical protein